MKCPSRRSLLAHGEMLRMVLPDLRSELVEIARLRCQSECPQFVDMEALVPDADHWMNQAIPADVARPAEQMRLVARRRHAALQESQRLRRWCHQPVVVQRERCPQMRIQDVSAITAGVVLEPQVAVRIDLTDPGDGARTDVLERGKDQV